LRVGVQYQAHARYDTTVPRLALVLRDLYPARLEQGTQAALPRLGALERWLAQGEARAAPGGWRAWLWREWVSREAGDVGQPAAPPASIAGAAVDGLGADQPLWFATPVHLMAGLDTVRLHPAGLLLLDAGEQAALAADFARVFAGSGRALHATGRRELLLAGGAAVAPGSQSSHDPARWLGADPRSGFPAGDGAQALRRLGAEIEMWLHEHPVNRARAGRGLLQANALWLWGGGAPALTVAMVDAAVQPGTRHSPQPQPIAWAGDLFVDGLARLRGVQIAERAQRWPAGPGDVLAVCDLGATPDVSALLALERDWLAPAFEHWRSGAVDSASLLAGDRAFTLRGPRWRGQLRRLRRSRPWWENLLQ
jgi:hypothetical protein